MHKPRPEVLGGLAVAGNVRFRRFASTPSVTVAVMVTVAAMVMVAVTVTVLPAPGAWAALSATTGASFSTSYVRPGATGAQATFVVPSFRCPASRPASASPGVGLTVMRAGAANSVVASVSMDCQGGVSSTEVNVVVSGGPESYPYGEARANEIQPGNKVTVDVSATASRATASVLDVTTNKRFEAVGAGGKAYSISAEVDTAGTATTTWPTPSFGQIAFSPVLFDGKPMGHFPLRVTNLVYDGKPEVTLKLTLAPGPFPVHSASSFTALYQAS